MKPYIALPSGKSSQIKTKEQIPSVQPGATGHALRQVTLSEAPDIVM